MQFRDLKQQYKVLKKEIDIAMECVATEGNYISGAQVRELEVELAKYVGVKHCITCANGTDALSIAMMAWDIKEGDAVFVPDFTFFASGEIVSHCGATPIFVDVNEDSFNICVESLENAIKQVIDEGKLVPKVIIAVDLFGLPADFDKIKDIAKKYNLLVLEDGAQGFGGEINGRKACSFGDIATTSFFPAKPLGCYGDGGAIFTNSDELAELMRSICVHGKGTMKYDNVRIGVNSRLDTLQAAILLIKLKAFIEYEVDSVNAVATKYSDILGTVAKTPIIPDGFKSSWAQYTLQLENEDVRNGLQLALKEKGIPTMVYYPKPMHKQKAFEIENEYQFKCDVTEKLCKTVLSLPMHPYLDDDDITEITNAIKDYIKR